MEHTVAAVPIDRSPVRAADARKHCWFLLLAAGCFLLARPYQGVVHDARLYVGYAIASLDPSGIGADILFTLDRQGSRSLFPLLLRTLIGVAAPSVVALGVTLLSLAAWFAALWQFVRRAWPALREREVAAFVIAATTLYTTYGALSLFRYAEPFPSPRVLAEALVLLALSATLRSQWLTAVMCVMGAGALHPLMAGVGAFVVGWCWLPGSRPRGLALAGGGIAAAALLLITALGLSTLWPFREFDSAWLAALSERHSLVFLRHWDALDWARLVVQGSPVVMVWPTLRTDMRSLVTGAATAAAGSVLLSFIGADLLHSEMLTQFQLWRALWLFALLAPLCLAQLLLSVVDSRSGGASALRDFRTCAFTVLVMAWFMIPLSGAAAILATVAMLLWWLPVWRPSLTLHRSIPAVMLSLMPLAIIGISLPVVLEVQALHRSSPSAEAYLRYLPSVVAAGGARLLGSVLVGLLIARPTSALTGVTVVLLRGAGAGILLASLWLFDARTGYQRELERHLDAKLSTSPIRPIAEVPEGSVFWPDGNLEAWAFLGRPGYATDIQGAPRVFSRALALQWADRNARLTRPQSPPAAPRGRPTIDGLVSDDPMGIRTLCTQPDAPVTVILPKRPAWAAAAPRVVLPSPQVLLGDDLDDPWETRRDVFIVLCSDVVKPASLQTTR